MRSGNLMHCQNETEGKMRKKLKVMVGHQLMVGQVILIVNGGTLPPPQGPLEALWTRFSEFFWQRGILLSLFFKPSLISLRNTLNAMFLGQF